MTIKNLVAHFKFSGDHALTIRYAECGLILAVESVC